ncbi:tetratricopeptide repeat protein [Chondromyces crocatus]|uniref:Uncharacterized protein n=1 Tax=Chondromyces crocatus TaxID=52 RepID=A0A0K1EBX6_CHOCO|nr:hypothetical protein [Chondromyces crocatus]AKT38058.1 uncharacterized protein CMC5_021990 [Chondromyces crocatus]
MSNDSHSRFQDGGDEDAQQEGTGEKATVPPPPMYGPAVSESDVEEATLLAKIPEELIHSIREDAEGRPSIGGLKQLFSREPAPRIPEHQPSEGGDALLDMLFDEPAVIEPEPDDGVVTSAPVLRGGARMPPPPRPPRLQVPPPPPMEEPAEDLLSLEEPEPEGLPLEAGDRQTPVPDGGDAEGSIDLAPPSFEEEAAAEELPEEDLSPPVVERVSEPLVASAGIAFEDSSAVVAVSEDDALFQLDPDAASPEVEALPALLPSIPPPSAAFDNEQDASAVLVQSQQRDAWAARAEWLRAEAEALDDKAARARALLPVAEMYAMAGEEGLARQIATEARELAPGSITAHRLVRGLLMREGDHATVIEALDAETRALPTPAARCHNAMLGAELSRLVVGDTEMAQKRLELGLRANSQDPRGHVQRFCEALASEGDPSAPPALNKFRVPDAPELAPLAAAYTQVAAHRGGTLRGRARPETGYEALLRARASLETGDLAGAIASFESLGGTSLAQGAGWLLASLAAPRKATRAASADALRGVVDGTHGDLARRALAARAIELGDAAAARAATSGEGEAFSGAARVALAALTGGTRDEVDPWISGLLEEPEHVVLGAAASAALSEPGAGATSSAVHSAGLLRARVGASLGRALARDAVGAEGSLDANEVFAQAVGAYADLAAENSISRALTLEVDLEARRADSVAQAVVAQRESEGDRDAALAAALLDQIAGEPERARAALDRARAAEPQHEGAARARAAVETGVEAAQILVEHAGSLEPGPRAAALLTEAAIRLLDGGAEPEEAERLLQRAAEADPKQPMSMYIGERSARTRVDRDALIEWLRLRREAAGDPLERAHDIVREALLVAESEPSTASALLEQALAVRPQDSGLRDLFERLAPEPPPDRAAWRAERAAEAKGAEAARLALEATLEYERAGDMERAAECAKQAIAAGEEQLAPIALNRAGRAGHGAGELIEQLITRAKEATDAVERRELYERLAELDEIGRSGWFASVLAEAPDHLPTLRRRAAALISEGLDDELEPTLIAVARALEGSPEAPVGGSEAIAHAMVSARLRLRALPWEETLEPVELAYRNQPRGVWALRQMAAHARVKEDHRLAIEADRQLIERTDRPSEAAALSVRTAKEASIAGSVEDTVAFFQHAITVVPGYLYAHLELASALERGGDMASAAAALEAAAEVSVTTELRAHALYRAAVLWLDEVKDTGRARQVFEAVAAIDPSYSDVFQRLQTIYIAEGARAELAALLERRLEAVTDPAERVEMEVLRGRALADVGDAAAAKGALAAALEANPDHVEALSAFADVSASEGDWSGAEQAWIRLARLIPDQTKQIAIYLRLGELYDEHLPNQERAELAYQEILKRSPTDASARERLVALYKRSGDSARAIEQQNILIEAAATPEEKCQRTAELAEIYEAAGDTKKAETTLLGARKAWPKDEHAIGALARFYLRNDQGAAANVLLDRALADARRALNTGRFEPYLFSTVATVAELRGRGGAAKVARATVSALEGQVTGGMEGAGLAAVDTSLDELIAPEVMTPAFRELLARSSPLLDRAVPFDLDSIRAVPLPSQHAELVETAQALGDAYGLSGLQVYVTPALGSVCIPASSEPPVIVLGQALVASPREDVRTFLIHRALKILQTRGSAFSRTAPIDLWPMFAAFLKALNPSWTPQGVDASRLTEWYSKVTRAMGADADPQLAVLAADIVGSIGNRASTLNTAINSWGNRAALLASGDLNVAFTAIAWSGGHTNAPPAEGKERITWIGRNAEARDLIVFSVSDSFADARDRLGLSS